MRVPQSEKNGRVQTSTVTVAVLDQHDPELGAADDRAFRIEWFSGTGAGGQHRNKHQNSCRLIHLPSGLIITSQTRSRVSSEAAARQEMRRRLTEEAAASIKGQRDDIRKRQVGSGMRADKIRTYRFSDDTVKDHLSGRAAPLRQVMAGGINMLWN